MLSYQKEVEYLNQFKTYLIEGKEHITFTWPSAFLLTPKGRLYHTGCNHRTGFLESYLDMEMKPIDNQEKIKEIEKKEKLGKEEKQIYSSVLYPEDILEKEKIKIEEDKNAESNMKTLLLGYLDAEEAICQSILMIKKENRKEMIEELKKLSNYYFADILVRYMGFHKLESTAGKVITTANPTISNLSSYLEKGFHINMVTPIIYDKKRDTIEASESYFFTKKLISEINENNYKGKIYVKNQIF